MAQVNAELRKQNPDLSNEDSDEDHVDDTVGLATAELARSAPEVPQEEEEYVDEDKFTTVTVEPMDDLGNIAKDDSDDDVETATAQIDGDTGNSKPRKKKPWGKDGKGVAKKKRAFRYESKGERAATRQKQKSKSHAAKVRRTGK